MKEIKFRNYTGKNMGYLYSENVGLERFFEIAKVHHRCENIEQYIGVPDKTGKDIYEGDTVRFYHIDEPEDSQISVVEEKGKIKGDFGEHGAWLIEWAMDAGYIFEIIGNKHENQELLN